MSQYKQRDTYEGPRGIQNIKSQDQKINSLHPVIVKTPNAENKEKMLEALREKGQLKFKDRPMRVKADFQERV